MIYDDFALSIFPKYLEISLSDISAETRRLTSHLDCAQDNEPAAGNQVSATDVDIAMRLWELLRLSDYSEQPEDCCRTGMADIAQIGNLPFCVAWATRGGMNSFFDVTEREAQFWGEAGIDWRAIERANLSKMSADRPVSGEKLDGNGRPFLKVMLHDYAVGPLRLLLPTCLMTFSA